MTTKTRNASTQADGATPTTIDLMDRLQRSLAGSLHDRGAQAIVFYNGPEALIIEDVGPWDEYPTITNDVEGAVMRVADILGERRLFYYDSEGELDEILVEHGHFVAFKRGCDLRTDLIADLEKRRARRQFGPESASEHLRNALQLLRGSRYDGMEGNITTFPRETVDAIDRRLTNALALVELGAAQ